jgi:hypothetical protein
VRLFLNERELKKQPITHKYSLLRVLLNSSECEGTERSSSRQLHKK